MSILAPQNYEKAKSAVRTLLVSFDRQLEVGESLTGTPTFTEIATSALTLDQAQLNAAAVDVNGKTVGANRVALARCAGGVAGTEYRIRVACGTTAAAAQTLVQLVRLRVRDDGT